METRVTVSDERAGLVSLGLIMQLVGSIVAAYLVVRALEPLLSWFVGQGGTIHFGDFYSVYDYQERFDRIRVAPPDWHLTLLASVGIVRALLHRRAGGAILYCQRGGASALVAYVAVALLHTGLCVAFFLHDSTGPTCQWTVAALLGAAWPMCLLIAATRRSFRRALRAGPAADDGTAPDEVATLAIFLGLVGALVAVFVIYAATESNDYWNSTRSSANALIVIGVLLLVRALVQLRSGLRIAGRAADTDADASAPLATARYVRAALVGSAFIAIALLVHLHRALLIHDAWGRRLDWFIDSFTSALPSHVLTAYLVVVWPALLLRFLAARKKASPVVDAQRPGASLAALGWFLLAAGALQIAFALLALIAGSTGARIAWDWARYSEYMVDAAPRSGWLLLLVAIPQIWTALELLARTRRRRASATAFAACASLAIVLANWGDLHYLSRLIGAGLPHPSILVAHLQFAFPLVVPIATLVFVQDHLRREGTRPAER